MRHLYLLAEPMIELKSFELNQKIDRFDYKGLQVRIEHDAYRLPEMEEAAFNF